MTPVTVLEWSPHVSALAPRTATERSVPVRRSPTSGRGEVPLAKGAALYGVSELIDRVHRVESGFLIVLQINRHGERSRVELIGPGGLFGELALAAPHPSRYVVQALTPARLAFIQVAESSSARTDIRRALGRVLALKVRQQEDTWLRVQRQDVRSRIAFALCEAAISNREVNLAESRPEVPADLHQPDLALAAWTCRETVNSHLRAFEHRGWIERVGRRPGPLRLNPERGLLACANRGVAVPLTFSPRVPAEGALWGLLHS
jgi:CRP-like cAMP-binding protein